MSKPPVHFPADLRLAFIGGGNMARALIGGLCGHGFDPARICVAEPQAAARDALASDFGVRVSADNREAASQARVVVLAVKPQVLRDVLAELSDALAEDALLLSIAAGITSEQIARWAGGGRRVVRSMPNTPALLGAGATGLFANPACTTEDRQLAARLLEAVGQSVWIERETLMDAVTAVSGSGPAYVFLLAEAMQAAGEAEGLPAEAARQLARQTLIGAAAMLGADATEAGELRRRVTSPRGTTEAAIGVLQAQGFEALVARAVSAARLRGAELSAAAEG